MKNNTEDNINNISGVLNLNKPAGCSSHDMVYFVRRMFGIKKVGHTGTLDPIATGVLPMLVGNATKLSDLLLNHDKSYRAVLKLGLTTDTMDITGKILKSGDVMPSYDEVVKTAESFIGEIMQTVPMYSAVKFNGRKLYEYARANIPDINMNLEPRKIKIYSLTCGKTDDFEKTGEIILNISCSKGTYIRTVCHDIGEKLGCGGVMASLCRIKSGNFDISSAYSPEYIENIKKYGDVQDIYSLLISCEAVLKDFADKKIVLGEFYSKLAKNGAEIYIKKLGFSDLDYKSGDKILMYDYCNILFAFGEIKNYENGLACKPQIFI